MDDKWKSNLAHFMTKAERNLSTTLHGIHAKTNQSGLIFEKKFREDLLQKVFHRLDDVLNRYQTVTAPTETVSNTTIRQSNENQNACAAIKNLFESLSLKKPLKLTNQFVHDEISSSVPAPSSIENSKAIAEKVISIEPTKIDPFGFVMRASGTEKKKSSSSSSSTTEPPVIPEAQPVAPVPDRILQNVKENIQNRSSEADSTTGSLPKKRKKYRSPIFEKPSKPPHLERLQYYCLHCRNESFNTVQNVYNHWWSAHSAPSTKKPFRYFVSESVKCFYCHETVALFKMKKHQDSLHTLNIPIVLISQTNPYECAICDYVGNDRIEHFETAHGDIMQNDVFNPLKVSDETLNDLLKVVTHKRLKCTKCNTICDTGMEMQKHSIKEHESSATIFEDFVDYQSIDIICGECNEEIMPINYMMHLMAHYSAFKCLECDFAVENVKELSAHSDEYHGSMKSTGFTTISGMDGYFCTKLVFSNGLVMEKYNLIGTKMDDSQTYVSCMKEFQKKRFNDFLTERPDIIEEKDFNLL